MNYRNREDRNGKDISRRCFYWGKFVVKFRSLEVSTPYPLVLIVNVGRRQGKALGSDSYMLHYGRNVILALKELRKEQAVQRENTVVQLEVIL